MVRLSPHRTSLSLQRVVDKCEECLGEGPLDFRIVQEKIALSYKISLEIFSKEGRRLVSSLRMTNIKQTIFEHVYLECDDDNISVSHSLS